MAYHNVCHFFVFKCPVRAISTSAFYPHGSHLPTCPLGPVSRDCILGPFSPVSARTFMCAFLSDYSYYSDISTFSMYLFSNLLSLAWIFFAPFWIFFDKILTKNLHIPKKVVSLHRILKFPFTPLLPQKGLKTLSEPMREKSGNRSS